MRAINTIIADTEKSRLFITKPLSRLRNANWFTDFIDENRTANSDKARRMKKNTIIKR